MSDVSERAKALIQELVRATMEVDGALVSRARGHMQRYDAARVRRDVVRQHLEDYIAQLEGCGSEELKRLRAATGYPIPAHDPRWEGENGG